VKRPTPPRDDNSVVSGQFSVVSGFAQVSSRKSLAEPIGFAQGRLRGTSPASAKNAEGWGTRAPSVPGKQCRLRSFGPRRKARALRMTAPLFDRRKISQRAGGADARDGDFGARRAVARACHEAPGVAKALEASAAMGSVGIQMNFDGGGEGANRDYVPGVSGHDVSHEKINIVRGVDPLPVGAAAMAGLNIITAPALDGSLGGFDLYAPEMRAGVKDEVVRLDFAIRFGDAETELGGFVHESEFGDVTATFAVAS